MYMENTFRFLPRHGATIGGGATRVVTLEGGAEISCKPHTYHQLISNMAECAQLPRIREVRAYTKKKAPDSEDQGTGRHKRN